MPRTPLRCALTLALAASALAAQPPVRQLKAPGLRAPVEILVDRWGVPHIYAKSLHDGYFAQGFNAAGERLWQMDLWRKRGLGRLSESFGAAYLEQDRAARLLLYRGDVAAEWPLYPAGTRETLAAFTAGINARIAMIEADPSLLPWEFRLLNAKPERWTPADLLLIRSAALSYNLSSEVARARLACQSGPSAPALRSALSVPWTPQLPDGFDPCAVSDDVLRDYRLGRQTSVNFGALRNEPPAPPDESNNWAISARRSASGRAILATDPHRPFAVPAFRYFAHVVTPELNLIGFGEPQHPGFVFGHNGTIAWGQTTFQVDMEDLYVYETEPGNPNAYRYQGEWRPMRLVREQVAVKGAAPREVVLKFTLHGPVLCEEPEKRRAWALRSGWLEPGSATFLGSLGLNRARNWKEFSLALERYRVPGNNVIYADAAGNIGLAPVGNAPRRPNWDGLYPAPGDGRYEWAGIRPNSELPRSYNPPEGYLASANNRPYFVAPEKFGALKIGYEFGEERIDRIREVLGAPGKITFEAALALQNDYFSRNARRLLPVLKELPAEGKTVGAARLLDAWDMVLRKDSAAAALFELWIVELTAARSGATGGPIENWLLALPAAERAKTAAGALSRAIERAEKLLGADWSRWQWGTLHQLRLEHALSPLVDPATREKLNLGGANTGKGGAARTVGSLGYDPKTFRITSGNSSRFVIDLGNWDASRFLHVPGQSGDPESNEYRNLLASWVNEEYNPLLYTRRAIEAATIRRLQLVP